MNTYWPTLECINYERDKFFFIEYGLRLEKLDYSFTNLVRSRCAENGIRQLGHDVTMIARERSRLIIKEIELLEETKLPFSVEVDIIKVRFNLRIK